MCNICSEIDIIITKYIKHELNSQDKLKLFNHITSCKTCREELVVMVKLHNLFKETNKEVPREIKKEAYDLVKEEVVINKLKNMKTDLVNIFRVPTPNVLFQVLSYMMDNIKNVVSLSLNKV